MKVRWEAVAAGIAFLQLVATVVFAIGAWVLSASSVDIQARLERLESERNEASVTLEEPTPLPDSNGTVLVTVRNEGLHATGLERAALRFHFAEPPSITCSMAVSLYSRGEFVPDARLDSTSSQVLRLETQAPCSSGFEDLLRDAARLEFVLDPVRGENATRQVAGDEFLLFKLRAGAIACEEFWSSYIDQAAADRHCAG